MTEELTVDVPLVADRHRRRRSRTHGGTLLHPIEHVRIRALPDHLPQSIEYSIDSLVDFDAVIKVSDLAIPGDVTLLTDADEIVAKVQAPRVEAEPEPVVAEGEAEEGAEGGEGEGARRARVDRWRVRAPTGAGARLSSRVSGERRARSPCAFWIASSSAGRRPSRRRRAASNAGRRSPRLVTRSSSSNSVRKPTAPSTSNRWTSSAGRAVTSA